MMMFETRPLHRDGGPLYRQAAAALRGAIARGVPGSPLPTEAELASRFGVSLITIRHALRELEAEGLIRKRAAKTAVIAEPGARGGVVRPLNSLDDIVAATEGARLEIAGYGPRKSVEAAEVFGLGVGEVPMCLRGRLVVGERALSEVTIFFPPAIGARLRREDFDDVVVFRSVERRLGIRIAGARITVSAERAGARLAKLLEYREGEAVLASRMVYVDAAGAPVEFTVARHRADLYRLRYEFATR